MPIRLENVGIAVRDLEATVAFFTDLGLTVLGRTRSVESGPTQPSAPSGIIVMLAEELQKS